MWIEHSKEEQMAATPSSAPGTVEVPGADGLKRSLSVWAAVGLSVALMAPSMAANINPQASAQTAGRAVPLTFLIAAVGVLLVAGWHARARHRFRGPASGAPGAEAQARP